jgi:arginyl-tRNA--protein-N-Asp/Glu arginylyltransferase
MNLFFGTEPAPCPYLAGRLERRLVTTIEGPDPERLHDQLLRAGFRRSQGYAYRPACTGCEACVPVRIPVGRFRFRRVWRRVLRDNHDLVPRERRAVATQEQYALFRRYLEGRHATSGMAEMTWAEFRSMIDDSPIDTRVIEWRRAAGQGLVAASLTDRCASGLSGVYKFFEPDEARRSLGTLIILWHIQKAMELRLPYVYLGYWIEGSPKMGYKARFQPLERLTLAGWQPLRADAASDAGQATGRALDAAVADEVAEKDPARGAA